ncbi:short chain dehydrogenase [Xylariomycetidae sp. FL2044]|nr:short chain dehydrogenase [Xylariomycetidae sp. FL2044]
MSQESLKGKSVIVTGAAGGLGKAIAAAFLEAGASVAVCDVNEERLRETEVEWAKKFSAPVFLAKVDITSSEAVQGFFRDVAARFGRVDMLVNNAGVMDTFDPVGSTTESMWDRVLSVNLTGAFLCTRAAVNAMETQSSPAGGVIISIGSVASYRGVNAGAAYTVSKHGLLGLVRNTAGFYGEKGIFSIALLLGGMDDTHLSESFMKGPFNQEGMMKIGAVNPGYVVGKTSIPLPDVAKYCLFFSDLSLAAASNGAAITVNKNWPAA